MAISGLERIYPALVVGALLVAGLARPGLAQQSESKPAAPAVKDSKNVPFRFGIVDVQYVLREAKATKAIRPQIEKMKNAYQSEFKKQEEDLRAAEQELQRQRGILSPEAFDRRRKEFQKKAGDVQRDVQEARSKLDEALGGAMSKVNRALREVTAEIARERSLQLILPRSTVLLLETRFDITKEVLKRLDKKLPSVTVESPGRTAEKKPKKK